MPRDSPACEGSATPDPLSEERDATMDGSGMVSGLPRLGHVGRFRLDSVLGEGGMGRVYEAWDPELQRAVAVKVLHGSSPRALERFLREARLQGSLSHPAICPVHEVGEADGSPYIVMARLRGERLDHALESATLEETLLVMREVALAMHEAHRAGLIHRDLKPANVMVEVGADGRRRPYVLDFGLARTTGDRNLTQDGAVVGTPEYMAPEQISGSAVDRRTDVYALGATLYRLLAGRTAFADSGYLGVVGKEPPPLREHGVPAEVEAIVFKCMEKVPGRRYGSARALAEDLRRYLDGEPVQARPAGSWYRFVKWARRNRALVAVSAVSAMLVSALLAWGLYTSWRAGERERLAREFTEQVEEIEALARYSKMSPLHDVRPDRELIRRRMVRLEEAMERAGATGRWIGEYALGRGHLALEDPETARRHLQGAWDGGYRQPEVAAAMARALSSIYREELMAAELVSDWETRQRRREQLEERFGDPARFFLRRSASAEGNEDDDARSRYLEALVAFHEDRFDEAVGILAPERIRPWEYEMDELAGDVYRSWAIERESADDRESAEDFLDRARARYASAIATAPSDLSLRIAETQVLVLEVASRAVVGESVDAPFEQGLASAEAALALHPDSGKALLWKGLLLSQGARSQSAGQDVLAGRIDAGIEVAERAVEELVQPSSAWQLLGTLRWRRSMLMTDEVPERLAELRRAAEALERVEPEHRDYAFHVSLGLVRMTRGDLLLSETSDPAEGEARSEYDMAIRAFEEAERLHSRPSVAVSQRGLIHYKIATVAEEPERSERLHAAVEVLDAARRLDGDYVIPPFYAGLSRLLLAQGGRPGLGLDRNGLLAAVEDLQAALAVAPNLHAVHNALGGAYKELAVARWDEGDDPSEAFRRSRAAFTEALERSPGNPTIRLNLAWHTYFEGKLEVRSESGGEARLRQALDLVSQLPDEAESPKALLCRGSAHRMLAELAVRRGQSAEQELAAADAAFQRILSIEKSPSAEVHRSLARLRTLEAIWRSRRGLRGDAALREAEIHLAKARAEAPGNPWVWQAISRRELLGAWEDLGSEAEAARAARQALRIRPRWAEAEFLAGWSRVALADLSGETAERDAGLARMGDALARRPELRRDLLFLEALRRATFDPRRLDEP